MNSGHRDISRRVLLHGVLDAAVLGVGAAACGTVTAGHAAAVRHVVPQVAAVFPLPLADAPSQPGIVAAAAHVAKPAHSRLLHAGAPPPWALPWPSAIRTIGAFAALCPRPVYPSRAIMLTLDDGPSPAWTPKMLALLAKHGVRATFCMIGKQVRAEPRLARAVAEHGHVVANHTWTHDEMLTKRPVARIRRELRDTSAVIADACGYEPRQFRAPGGNWGRALLDEVQREQMLPLGWSVDPTDWARPGTRSIERTFRSVRRHDIVLCHDGGGDRSQTYAALEYALPRWKDAGYTFVTLPSPRSRFAE